MLRNIFKKVIVMFIKLEVPLYMLMHTLPEVAFSLVYELNVGLQNRII
jgi:hypothetical protein